MPDTVRTSRPTCLVMADLGGPQTNDWQSHWQRRRDDCVRVDLGCWNDPIRNVWLGRIDQAIGQASGPVVVVAHGLSALTLVWWAALLGKSAARKVVGALLVAPPDPERSDADARLRGFGPLPTAMLPFPSILVASETDPRASIERSHAIAAEWVSDFVNVGDAGHLGAGAKLGRWQAGEQLLDILVQGGPGLSRYAYRHEPPTRKARPVLPSREIRPSIRS